ASADTCRATGEQVCRQGGERAVKRIFVFAAFVTVAATLAGTGNAASFSGVVVAKDAKRKAIVTASARAVRTVRAPASFGGVRLGQRVAVRARPLADGTFRATSVRPAGRGQPGPFRAG